MSLTLTDISPAARGTWARQFRATLALAWPLVLTNLAQIALTTTDILVLGRVGSQALAAATLGVNLYLALLIFATGLITATAPMIAEALGRKRKSVRDIRRTFRQGLWSAAILSVPAWIVLWFTEPILRVFGQEPQLAADARDFMRALQWGFFPALGFVALRSFVSALERPLWTMYVTAATIVFNIVANWALVFGHLGLPAMGLRGSGLATTISNVFLFVTLSLVVAFHRRFRRYALFGRWWRPDRARLATLWRIGIPIGATMAFEITVFNAAVFVMGWFGQSAIAAHSIAIQIAAVCFMVPMGLAQAATVRVARAFGALDRDGITRAGWTAFGLTVVFNITTSVLLLTLPLYLIGAFIATDDPANAEVVALAVSFLFCAALFQLVDGAQAVGAGMLRGLQDTRVPMIYAGLGYWGLGMPIGILLAFTGGMQGTGVWIGLAAGLAIVAAMMMVRWVRRERLGLLPSPLAGGRARRV